MTHDEGLGKTIITVILFLWLTSTTMALGACGRKDAPHLPEGKPDEFNKTYPNPNL